MLICRDCKLQKQTAERRFKVQLAGISQWICSPKQAIIPKKSDRSSTASKKMTAMINSSGGKKDDNVFHAASICSHCVNADRDTSSS